MRALRVCAVLALGLAVSSPAWSATLDDCNTLRKHGKRDEAQACFQSLTQGLDPYLRAEGYWGLEMYKEANDTFRDLVDLLTKPALSTAAGGCCCSNASITPMRKMLSMKPLE